MAAFGNSSSAGPCDNKLQRLAEGLQDLHTAAGVVQTVVDKDTAFAVAKDLLYNYDSGSCMTCWGKCTGRCNQRFARLNQLRVAAEGLEGAPMEEAKELLEAVTVKQSSAEPRKGGLLDHNGTIGELMWRCDRKFKQLEEQRHDLLEARAAAKSASQAMRASLKRQEDNFTAPFESATQAPGQIVAELRAAAESERKAQGRVQAMANEFATHLATVHRFLCAQLEKVAQHRAGMAEDLVQLGLLWAEEEGTTQALPYMVEDYVEEEPAMMDPREETRLCALTEAWAEIKMIGEGAGSGAAGADGMVKTPASRSPAASDDDPAMKFTRLISSASTQAPTSASPPGTPRSGSIDVGY